MELQLAVVQERIEHGRKAVQEGSTSDSEQALLDANALIDQMRKDLLKLDAQALLLERDLGIRRYGEGSPWRAGFRDRGMGILPQSSSDALYLRGWEIADRLIQHNLLSV